MKWLVGSFLVAMVLNGTKLLPDSLLAKAVGIGIGEVRGAVTKLLAGIQEVSRSETTEEKAKETPPAAPTPPAPKESAASQTSKALPASASTPPVEHSVLITVRLNGDKTTGVDVGPKP